MKALHLAKRFFTSLVARPPTAEEEAWVAERLLPGEFELWQRQTRYDRRHTYGVARMVESELTGTPDAGGPWPAAALLHDVGKVEARLGLVGRVIATLAIAVLGRDRVARWSERGGWWGRAGRYADHPALGARLVQEVGGRDTVATWAAAHHGGSTLDPGAVDGVPERVVRALLAADMD